MFQQVPLKEVASVRSGFAFRSEDWRDEGVPVVRIKNVKEGHLLMEDCAFVSEAVAERAEPYELRRGDVLITMTGDIAETAIVRNEGRLLLNQRVGRFNVSDPDRLDSKYLYYVLRFPPIRETIKAHAYGVAQANISPDLIEAVPVPLPRLDTQRKIAAILSAYDDLLENNTRRIQILEEMAQAIYREWFVEFRFPGHSGMRMTESQLGSIPKGWRVATLGELCETLQSGGTPSRSEEAFWDRGTISWFKTKELRDSFLFESEERITEAAVNGSSARIFQPGTILMAIYGSPTVGRLGVLTQAASCNQAALGLVSDPTKLSQRLLFYLLMDQKGYFNNIAQGAAQQNISKAKVAATRVLVPEMSVQDSFDSSVGPVWEDLRNLREKNSNLRSTKDLLLPKLMSGELDVARLIVDSDDLVT